MTGSYPKDIRSGLIHLGLIQEKHWENRQSVTDNLYLFKLIIIQEVTENDELILMYRFYYHMELQRCIIICYLCAMIETLIYVKYQTLFSVSNDMCIIYSESANTEMLFKQARYTACILC